MLSTLEGKVIRARPMAASVVRKDNAFYFLTDSASHKDNDIDANPTVNLAFADTSGQKYVSISGKATVSDDRSKIREIWSTPAKAWWDSPDDPSLRLLKVDPQDAHFWDSPGTVVSYVKMLAAAATGSRPPVGRSAEVTM